MRIKKVENYPIIEEIKSGWAARGDGWAVHAATREEVVKQYNKRKEFYKWLATQPFIYEKAKV